LPRRVTVIPAGERAVLKLMFAALMRASQTWQRIVVSEFEQCQIEEQARLGAHFRGRANATARFQIPRLRGPETLTQLLRLGRSTLERRSE
jgi:hypothetical protein